MLEEPLAQHPDMAKLHPQSVNTMRIVTDRVGDTVHIAYIVLKIGRGDGFCDNSGQGGVICRVDEKTGKICSVATDDYFNVYETHPDTGIRFEGYQLPMVQEAVDFAKKAALVVPQICHVGWTWRSRRTAPCSSRATITPERICASLRRTIRRSRASGRITRKF